MIKPGISSPTDLEGFSLLMALQTSASEMGQGIKIQKTEKDGESPENNGYYKQTESALRKHQQLRLAGPRVHHQLLAEWNQIYVF
jgi:hypothetical protein